MIPLLPLLRNPHYGIGWKCVLFLGWIIDLCIVQFGTWTGMQIWRLYRFFRRK